MRRLFNFPTCYPTTSHSNNFSKAFLLTPFIAHDPAQLRDGITKHALYGDSLQKNFFKIGNSLKHKPSSEQ